MYKSSKKKKKKNLLLLLLLLFGGCCFLGGGGGGWGVKQTLTAARTALQVLASSSSTHSIFSLSGIHPLRTQEQK